MHKNTKVLLMWMPIQVALLFNLYGIKDDTEKIIVLILLIISQICLMGITLLAFGEDVIWVRVRKGKEKGKSG